MVIKHADPVASHTQAAPKPRAGRSRPLTPTQESRRAKVVANLLAPNVIPEDERQLERTYYGVAEAFRPRNRWQEWLTARIATMMTRVDRSERVERKLRDWASYRAFDFWDDDRELLAHDVAGRLRRDPGRAVRKLKQIPAGIDWLVGRWRSLAKLAPGDWTDEDHRHAADLLGGDESVDPATPGFAAAQIEALEADRARVEEADAILRGLVEADLSDSNVPDLNKLRREVRASHRQLKWYADQFHVEHPDRWDDPMRRPASEKVTPDGFREVNYNHFEGPRTPASPPTPPRVEAAPVELRPGERDDCRASGRTEFGITNPTVPVASFAAALVAPSPTAPTATKTPDRAPTHPPKGDVLTREQARRLKRSRRNADRAASEPG